MQDIILDKGWKTIAAAEHVGAVLESWKGTPYMALQCAKGKAGGVDCIRAVCGVADDLYGFSRGPVTSLPPDQALHDRQGAIRAMRLICRRYAPLQNVTDCPWLEPGDILVSGPTGGGPGHAMFVGARRSQIWEATFLGFQMSGMPAFGKHAQLFRIYRVLDKHKWVNT